MTSELQKSYQEKNKIIRWGITFRKSTFKKELVSFLVSNQSLLKRVLLRNLQNMKLLKRNLSKMFRESKLKSSHRRDLSKKSKSQSKSQKGSKQTDIFINWSILELLKEWSKNSLMMITSCPQTILMWTSLAISIERSRTQRNNEWGSPTQHSHEWNHS